MDENEVEEAECEICTFTFPADELTFGLCDECFDEDEDEDEDW